LETATVKWFKDAHLDQIYSKGLEYAFFNEAGEQCHPFAFCKDFLQDAVWATLNKAAAHLYGFSYEYGVNPPLDLKQTRLGLRMKGAKGFAGSCTKALSFIQTMEKDFDFQPSTMTSLGCFLNSKSEVLVFVSDQRWLHSPVMLSLYSLALRVGLTYEGGSWREHFEEPKDCVNLGDRDYNASAKRGLNKLLGKDLTKVFAPKFEDNYPKDCGVKAMHNCSGIVSFAKGQIDHKVKGKWSK